MRWRCEKDNLVDVVEVWVVERERMRGSGDRRLFVPRRPVPPCRGVRLLTGAAYVFR